MRNIIDIAEKASQRLTRAIKRTMSPAECLPDIGEAGQLIFDTVARGNTVFACGNGGSAATAQHFTAELVGRYVDERGPLPALSLHTDSSLVTALGNDYGFGEVFARQLRGLGKPGDALVALSTSGASENVLKAMATAHELGMNVVVLTGQKGMHLKTLPHVAACIAVPDTETARIQEVHDLIIHVFCEYIDVRMMEDAHAQ